MIRRQLLLDSDKTHQLLYVKNGGGSVAWDGRQLVFDSYEEAIPYADLINGYQIWAEQGVMLPTDYVPGLGTSDPRDRSFVIPQANNSFIYGGFVGTENDPSERNPANYTNWSGDHGGGDENKSYHVMFHNRIVSTSSPVIIDGFKISGGNANGLGGGRERGGGFRDQGTSSNYGLEFRNCIIEDNLAEIGGGGYTQSLTISPHIFALFQNNEATNHSGGLYATNATAMLRCKFLDNEAPLYASCRITSGSYYETFCEFIQTNPRPDTASSVGGSANGFRISNCRFKNENLTVATNGLVLSMDNCTLIDGYHVFQNTTNSTIEIYNSIIKTSQSVNIGDKAPSVGHTIEIYNSLVENLIITSTAIQDFQNNLLGTTDPLFTNPAGGDYTLQDNSPCVNTGDDALVVTSEDLLGNPRIYGIAVDMGAYENQTEENITLFTLTNNSGLATNLEVWTSDGENVFVDWGDGVLQELIDQTLTGSDIVPTNIIIYSKTPNSSIIRISSTINQYAFDISDLSRTLQFLDIVANPAITGDLANLPSTITWYNLQGNTVINTYTPGHVFDAAITVFIHLPAATFGVTSTVVDNVIIDADNSVMSTGQIGMAGNNSGRTAASDVATTSLQGRGVVVITN